MNLAKKITNSVKKNVRQILVTFLSLAFVIFSIGWSNFATASDTTQLSQSVMGALDVQVVDADGNAVASPGIAFPAKAFSMNYQTSTATLGTSGERMRVTNPSGTTHTWTLNVGATNGATAVWSDGSNHYDFNDATANGGDGADTDSIGGQMTVDPSAATVSGAGGTSTANVSKGTSDSFVEGTTDSIDLMSAASGAASPGQWDLTGTTLSQAVPGAQAVGSYTLEITLTAI